MSPLVKAFFECLISSWSREVVRIPPEAPRSSPTLESGRELSKASIDQQCRRKSIFWEKMSDRLHINLEKNIARFNFSKLYFMGRHLKNTHLSPSQEYCYGFIIHFIANPKAYINFFMFKVVQCHSNLYANGLRNNFFL